MFHWIFFVCFLVVYQKDDNYCCGELLQFSRKGKLGWKSTECATMMRVYLLLLTVRMTRIITTIILTEAHEVAVQRAQRLHLPWHETFFPGLKAQAWCCIYEQTGEKPFFNYNPCLPTTMIFFFFFFKNGLVSARRILVLILGTSPFSNVNLCVLLL